MCVILKELPIFQRMNYEKKLSSCIWVNKVDHLFADHLGF